MTHVAPFAMSQVKHASPATRAPYPQASRDGNQRLSSRELRNIEMSEGATHLRAQVSASVLCLYGREVHWAEIDVQGAGAEGPHVGGPLSTGPSPPSRPRQSWGGAPLRTTPPLFADRAVLRGEGFCLRFSKLGCVFIFVLQFISSSFVVYELSIVRREL